MAETIPQQTPKNTTDIDRPDFKLQINPDLQGFQSISVTDVDDSLPYRPAKLVEVTKADGMVTEADANTPYAVFSDSNGDEITISIAAAGHIDELHVKGAEPGSKFGVDSLDELMGIVSENLPSDIAQSEGVSAFSVETGKPMGEEGVAGLEELLEKGLISPEDIEGLAASREQISQLNLEGSSEEKDAFVAHFNETYVNSKIKLQLVRGGVIVPAADRPKQPTTKLFMVFGPGKTGKTMYTMAPGRLMPKMPKVTEHTSPDGVVNVQSFEESSIAWLNTVMLTGDSPIYEEGNEEGSLSETNDTTEGELVIKQSSVRFDAKSGTLLLSLGSEEIVDPGVKEAAEAEGFEIKDKLHLTVIGFKQGKLLKAALKANPELATEIEELAMTAAWGVKLTGERYKLSKLYDGEDTPRESIIEMLQCSGIEDFFTRINSLTGLDLHEQPPHVTLFTKGNPKGIGITSAEEIEELGKPIS